MNECISTVSHSKVKLEEKGRKAIFLNPTRENYEVGRIDGCLISDGPKADFFISSSTKTVFVELKGCNVDHACKQLFAAVEHENVKDKIRKEVGFVVICSRLPSASSSTLRAQQRARRKYRAKFRVYCNQRELSISEC